MNNTSKVRTFSILLSLSFLIVLVGCSVADNLSAYFNTYYNASRLFSEVESEIELQRDPRMEVDYSVELFTTSPGARQKLTSVIEKCSKLLQYHPESGLVDDALFMIGKSYYYQNDLQRAERKFLELLDGYPESDMAPENKLLLGSTYYKMKDPIRAKRIVRDLFDASIKEDDGDMIARSAQLLARIEIDAANNQEALTLYQTAADHASSAVIRAETYRHAGELLVKVGDRKEAIRAYEDSYNTAPDFVHEYRARIGLARVLSLQGQHDESFTELLDLRDNSNYKDFFGEIDLEIANVYRAISEFGEAIAQYTFVDSTYARTETSLKSYFALGDMYEKELWRYDSARVAYNRGRSEYPQSPLSKEIAQRADYLNRHDLFLKEIGKLDSIKAVLLAPPDTSIAVIDKDSTTLTPDSLGESKLHPVLAAPQMSLDTLNSRLAYNLVELAGLFYSTIGVIDSAKFWYHELLERIPDNAYVPRALFTLAQIDRADSTTGGAVADSLYHVLASDYSESEFGREATRILGGTVIQKADPAERKYSSAVGLIEKGKSSEALDSLKGIVREFPESPLASKAQYAVGWVYEELQSRPDSALQSYKRLIDLYPSSEYARAVRVRIPAATVPNPADSTALPKPEIDGEEPRMDNPFLPQGIPERGKAGTAVPAPTPEKPDVEKP
ncbi:MAG TPA: tetratricopeptide repeat protein [Bacteroidota bacterium]